MRPTIAAVGLLALVALGLMDRNSPLPRAADARARVAAKAAAPSTHSHPPRPASNESSCFTGVVLDAFDKPVAGADIEAVTSAAEQTGCCGARPILARARTERDGRFSLTCAATDFQLIARDGWRGLAATPATHPGPHTIRFALPARIEGCTSDGAGRRVPHATVTARLQPRAIPGETVERRIESDDAGAFVLDALSPEFAVILEARAAGFRPAQKVLPLLTPGAMTAARVELLAGERRVGLVRDSDGDPVADAAIEAEQGDGVTVTALSDADGTFALDGIGPGTARIIARKEGYALAVEESASAAQPATLTLPRMLELCGRVEPARADLYAVVVSGSARYRVQIAGNGRFRLTHAPDCGTRLDIETSDRQVVASRRLELRQWSGELVVALP